MAAYARAAKYSGADFMAKAREGRWRKYLAEVDPDGTLPQAERERRADAARRRDLAAMTLKSLQALRLRSRADKARNEALELVAELLVDESDDAPETA